jgi:hypothetical protein
MQQASYEQPLMMFDAHYRPFYTVTLPLVGLKDHYNQQALTATVKCFKNICIDTPESRITCSKTHLREECYEKEITGVYIILCNS